MRCVRLFGIGLFALAASCGSKDTSLLTEYIAQVSTGGISAALVDGDPTPGSGPAVTLSSGGITIPGGSKYLSVTSPTPFNSLAIMVEGVPGYYELRGLGSSTSSSVVVTFAQTPPETFTMQVAAGSTGGYGASAPLPITMTNVGTGIVQINVSWDVDSDVDLHVVDPTGSEIYYGDTSSTSGGTLDLDSNAACSLDHKRSENITWTNSAPRGTYTIRVDYFEACSVTATHYIVTANVVGQPAKVFTGTLTGDGDYGGQGDGITVGTVTY